MKAITAAAALLFLMPKPALAELEWPVLKLDCKSNPFPCREVPSQAPARFDASLNELVRQGVVSLGEQKRLRGKQPCAGRLRGPLPR